MTDVIQKPSGASLELTHEELVALCGLCEDAMKGCAKNSEECYKYRRMYKKGKKAILSE